MRKDNRPTTRNVTLLIIIGIFIVIIDVLQISYQFNPDGQPGWQLTIAPSIKTSTIILVLILSLPILLPFINNVISQGYIRRLTGTLRNEGIEEIETNIVRIKLSAQATQTAAAYEEKVLEKRGANYNLSPVTYQEQFTIAYSEVSALAGKSKSISPETALDFINELAGYYDEIRERFPGSGKRTSLMSNIASIIWSIIPNTQNFPLEEYINSPSGGKRLASYKYLEWQPSTDYLDDLLVRALGVLEVPFGQYNALMALQRLTTTLTLDESQKRKIAANLKWHRKLRHLNSAYDRKQLMSVILKILESDMKPIVKNAG